MHPVHEIIVLVCFLIVIFDYFKEVSKNLFYFACWVCITAAMFDPSTGGFTSPANLFIAFLIFMAFNQRRKREIKSQAEPPRCTRCASQLSSQSHQHTVD